MTHAWIHTTGDNYWEGFAIVVHLPALPRIGETVYLTEETLRTILEKSGALLDVVVTDQILVKENFTVTDICHIEGEELPHLMIDLTEHLPMKMPTIRTDRVAPAIKADFKRMRLTYRDAALRLGTTKQVIANRLSGKRPFTKRTARIWAEKFGYSMDFLLFGWGNLYDNPKKPLKDNQQK